MIDLLRAATARRCETIVPLSSSLAGLHNRNQQKMHGAGGAMPSNMSEINALHNALPRPIQEKLLVFFAGMLFTPTES